MHAFLLSDLNELMLKGDLYLALLVVLACSNSFHISKSSELQLLVRCIGSEFQISPHFQTKFLQNPESVMKEVVGSYLEHSDGHFYFSNEYVYDMVTYAAGLTSPETAIRYCSSAFLCDHVHFVNCNCCVSLEHILYLEDKFYDLWFNRIVAALTDGYYSEIFFSPTFLCKIESFAGKLRYITQDFLVMLFTKVGRCHYPKEIKSNKHFFT